MKHIIIVFLSILCLQLTAQDAIYSATAIHHPVVSTQGMVATQHHEATKVRLAILEKEEMPLMLPLLSALH